MKNIARFFITLLFTTLPFSSGAVVTESLCKGDEKVVFSCHAKSKIVSVCALNDLKSSSGKLFYRFGKTKTVSELEYSNRASPIKEKYAFEHYGGAKGASTKLSFKLGAFRYDIYHDYGVFGTDAGPNQAGVRVVRDGKKISEIACDEVTAVDNMYQELQGIGLSSDAL